MPEKTYDDEECVDITRDTNENVYEPGEGNSFFEQVYSVVAKIPVGKVVSYGQIAWMLGRPRAAREVGRAMRYCPAHLPAQRVVMADGTISGGDYAQTRRALLLAEGVAFLPDERVDMKRCRWLA